MMLLRLPTVKAINVFFKFPGPAPATNSKSPSPMTRPRPKPPPSRPRVRPLAQAARRSSAPFHRHGDAVRALQQTVDKVSPINYSNPAAFSPSSRAPSVQLDASFPAPRTPEKPPKSPPPHRWSTSGRRRGRRVAVGRTEANSRNMGLCLDTGERGACELKNCCCCFGVRRRYRWCHQ